MYAFEDIPKNILCMRYYFSKKWIKPVTAQGIKGLEKFNRKRFGDEND